MPTSYDWHGGTGFNSSRGYSGQSTGQRRANRGTAQSLAQLAQMQNAMNAPPATVGGGGGNGNARVNAARNEVYGLARGGRDRAYNDPVDAMIFGNLAGQIQGEGLPFNQETINNLRSVNSDNTAAAEAAQVKNLPGRPGDPGYEAAKRELMSQRQQRNQSSDRDINTQARLQNFGAMNDAINRLFGFNDRRESRLSEADRYLISLLSQENATDDTPLLPQRIRIK